MQPRTVGLAIGGTVETPFRLGLVHVAEINFSFPIRAAADRYYLRSPCRDCTALHVVTLLYIFSAFRCKPAGFRCIRRVVVAQSYASGSHLQSSANFRIAGALSSFSGIHCHLHPTPCGVNLTAVYGAPR